MKVYAEKKCDLCSRTVATKYFLRYNTVMDYVTIRGDEVPTYVNYEDSTTRVDKHYCYSCWSKILFSTMMNKRGEVGNEPLKRGLRAQCLVFDDYANLDAGGWIPVTEKLPNENEYVLAWSKYGILEAAFWNGHKWFTTWDYDELLEVTHWMPQPKPPIDNMPDSKRYRYFGR